MVGGILIAYITVTLTEQVWTVQTTLGLKYGPDEGKCTIIVCALYGLKSTEAAFCAQNRTEQLRKLVKYYCTT